MKFHKKQGWIGNNRTIHITQSTPNIISTSLNSYGPGNCKLNTNETNLLSLQQQSSTDYNDKIHYLQYPNNRVVGHCLASQ